MNNSVSARYADLPQAQQLEPGRPRLFSIDVYRGFVMFLMLAEVLRLPKVAQHFPDSTVWKWIAFHTSHVEWTGCSLHDLIQPSFSFLVGLSLPFSIAARRSHGQAHGRLIAHAACRAVVLTFLGVFLRSVGRNQTNFTFEDTLSQIGMGYFFLFLLGLCPIKVQIGAFLTILVGYWGAFALYPLPPSDFDYAAVAVPSDWKHHATGLAAHWNKNSNLAWAFDTWFLNLFPREQAFVANKGGYVTLSFIPTLGTMLMGLIAGGLMRHEMTTFKRAGLMAAIGAACLGIGWALQQFGICPVVKRIWTPAWTVYSGGWCLLILSVTHLICDGVGFRSWGYPLIVIGANSIFIYSIHGIWEKFIVQSFKTHLGQGIFQQWGETYEPMVAGAAVLIVFWLMLLWMYRHRILIRI